MSSVARASRKLCPLAEVSCAIAVPDRRHRPSMLPGGQRSGARRVHTQFSFLRGRKSTRRGTLPGFLPHAEGLPGRLRLGCFLFAARPSPAQDEVCSASYVWHPAETTSDNRSVSGDSSSVSPRTSCLKFNHLPHPCQGESSQTYGAGENTSLPAISPRGV